MNRNEILPLQIFPNDQIQGHIQVVNLGGGACESLILISWSKVEDYPPLASKAPPKIHP